MTSEELFDKITIGFNETSEMFNNEIRSTPPDLQSRTVVAQKWANLINRPISLIPCTPRYGEQKGKLWGYNVAVGVYSFSGTVVINPQ